MRLRAGDGFEDKDCRIALKSGHVNRKDSAPRIEP
jgi:hypothetical protein